MEPNSEIMLFDLASFVREPLLDAKQLYNATIRTLGGFSSQPQDYDDIVEMDILLRQLDAIRNEIFRMKKAREERVVSEDNPLLTLDEAAQILRLSPETVRDEIKAGKIKAKPVDKRGQMRILKSDLASYLGVKKIIFTTKDTIND